MLAVDDRYVAFCEYNGSVARIICVAVATLANEKLLKCASEVPGRFAPNPVRPLSRFAPNPVRPDLLIVL